MENEKELTLRDLMQMAHDLEDFQKDFDMVMEFMSPEEIRTFLKKELDK